MINLHCSTDQIKFISLPFFLLIVKICGKGAQDDRFNKSFSLVTVDLCCTISSLSAQLGKYLLCREEVKMLHMQTLNTLRKSRICLCKRILFICFILVCSIYQLYYNLVFYKCFAILYSFG